MHSFSLQFIGSEKCALCLFIVAFFEIANVWRNRSRTIKFRVVVILAHNLGIGSTATARKAMEEEIIDGKGTMSKHGSGNCKM